MNTKTEHAKHTPGPWEVKVAANYHTAVYPANSKERVADIYCPMDVKGKHSANAHLIASAPDLLEALKLFISIYPPNTRRHPDVSIAICRAQEAIDKAEGR